MTGIIVKNRPTISILKPLNKNVFTLHKRLGLDDGGNGSITANCKYATMYLCIEELKTSHTNNLHQYKCEFTQISIIK